MPARPRADHALLPSPSAAVESLAAVAHRFTGGDRRLKLRLLAGLEAAEIRDARGLRTFHESLCFLQAYPDNPRVLAAVDRALERFPERVRRLGAAARSRLDDSGIAGTSLEYPFGFPMARWLATHFPRDVEISWGQFTGGERLQESLPLLLQPAEHDAFSDEGGLGWRRWLDVARAGRARTDLQVLVELFERAELGETARDWLFESLGLSLRWRLAARESSRTFARLPWPRPTYRSTRPAARRPSPAEFLRAITRPLPSLRPAPRPLALSLIEAARRATATRLRELFAFAYANPADIRVADTGHGRRVALIGLLPRTRLPFEGYYAYLALENGVPIGYGGGWQLFDVLELGANVFESFRRGESASILADVVRAYHQAFGMRHVFVDAYQIGRENREALLSGAFYFYQRLGFRSVDEAVRHLAREEEAKIARDPGYRSPPAILRRLAGAGMALTLAPGQPLREDRLTASRLASLVTGDIARRFRGDRREAVRSGGAEVARHLGVEGRSEWPVEERRAFDELSLLVALIPDLSRWPAADRQRLTELLRSKGGPSEARYVRLLDGHRKLRSSLEALAARSLTSAEPRAPRAARSPEPSPRREAR
ncbi:MAG TPA: hypothetical protein VEL75_15495 [Candidatus Methylomirabilis sp.]|nr:hypothetical protein [Candidatus Methylomirabilis sp.]